MEFCIKLGDTNLPRESEKLSIELDWDLTHLLNLLPDGLVAEKSESAPDLATLSCLQNILRQHRVPSDALLLLAW